MEVREARQEDRVALWEWRTDPMTRTLFPCEQAVTYEQHRRWFERTMASEDVLWCVGLVETLRIGCVRFDQRNQAEYHVSVFLKPPYCGKGYGTALLNAAIEHLKGRRPVRRLLAQIRKVNPASGTLFQNAGFSITEEGNRLHGEMICSVPLPAAPRELSAR